MKSTNKSQTAALSTGQIERALEYTLNAGSKSLAQQIRYLLAYCQMQNLYPNAEAYQPKPLSTSAARLGALVDLAPRLNAAQIEPLYNQLNSIADPNIRLSLQSQILQYFPDKQVHSRVRELWSQFETLDEPVIETRVLLSIARLSAKQTEQGAPSNTLAEVIELAQKITATETRLRSLVALAINSPAPTSTQLYRIVLDNLRLVQSETLHSTTIMNLARQIPVDVEQAMLESARSIRSKIEKAAALSALVQAMPDREDIKLETLDVITQIEGEEERTDVLASFARYLYRDTSARSYPIPLEKALAVAIGITKRPLRARALVALAPHLTDDLKGETLAVVHSLSNEHERANLLVELAPNLPANMLIASLAVAHTMREQDARVHALSTLARYVPDHARSQTMSDALAVASNLPNHLERVRVLLDLSDFLPAQLQEQAFTNALETTRLIVNDNARARALSLLANHLPDNLISRAIDEVYKLATEQKLTTLISFAPRLQGEHLERALNDMLQSAEHMTFEYKRGRSLVSIAPHLTADLMPEAFRIGSTIKDPYDRVTAYIALAKNLSPEQRPQSIERAWKLIEQIEDGYDRASAIVSIAPYLSPEMREQLKLTIVRIIRSVGDDYDKASTISLLAPILGEDQYTENSIPLPDRSTLIGKLVKSALAIPYQHERCTLLKESAVLWAELEDTRRYVLWQDVVRKLKTLPLADVLLCLSAMIPVFRALAGEDSVQKLVDILGLKQ